MKGYKVEGHLHVKGNSGCAMTSVEDIVKIYKGYGYSGIIVTNHFNKLIYENYFKGSDEEKINEFFKTYNQLKENKEGLKIYFGVEFALGEDHYGLPLKKKCAELLVYGITPDEFKDHAISIINNGYEDLKALAESKGWLVFQAHPFRERTKLISLSLVDGIESYNGNPRHLNNNGKAKRYMEKNDLLEVAGSDFHLKGDVSSAMVFTELPNDEKELISALKMHSFSILKGRKARKRI